MNTIIEQLKIVWQQLQLSIYSNSKDVMQKIDSFFLIAPYSISKVPTRSVVQDR